MPYIETALIGDEQGNDVLHLGSIRYRVTGSGNLIPTVSTIDGTATQLTSVAMSNSPGREPVSLCNVISQKVKLRLETTVINEVFRFNTIILFAKPIWSNLPQ